MRGSSVMRIVAATLGITAALLASGLSARGIAAVSTMVTSSVPRSPFGSMLIEPSDLPLVRRLTASAYCTR